jgi:hypothetical protein
LELTERRGGPVAEDSVHTTRVETQGAQATLQLGDIVAMNHGRTPVQSPVTEGVTRFHHGSPCLSSADAVAAQTALALEGGHSASGHDIERARGSRCLEEAEPDES